MLIFIVFLGTNSHLLLLTLPQSSALHSPEKAKTEMISWKVTQLNKIHRWTPEKERGLVDGGWG